MPFRKFALDAGILHAIQKAGYVRPTPVQTAAVPKALEGKDLVAIAQTGTGKTAAFVWPMLHRLTRLVRPEQPRSVRALILAPTRELAIQITDNIRNYGQSLPIRVAAIYGGMEETGQIATLRKGVHILVATPGRLIDLLQRRKLNFSMLDILVLDEADRMLHMGFLPDIETIASHLPDRRQTLMFSATFPKEVENLARRFLHHPTMVRIGGRPNPADTVNQSVHEVPEHRKAALLLELLRQPKFGKVLVFVRTKDGANHLTDFLRLSRVPVTKLHSSRSQEQRERALRDFKDGKIQVLVATDIVARGIDIEGVSHVVNYDLPVNAEDYIHRIGRTGRAEALGDAISFVPRQDLNLLGILELAIGRRLDRKRLRGFDYHAPAAPSTHAAKPPKRDWRKRTREMEEKRDAPPKNKTRRQSPSPPKKRGKRQEPS